MEHPPTDNSDWPSLCACQKRRLGYPIRFADLRNAAAKALCRMCALFEQIVVAVADGYLEDSFEGLEDKSQRAEILETIIVSSEREHTHHEQQECELSLLIKGHSQSRTVRLFQDAEDEIRTTVCGFTFPTDFPFGPGIDTMRGICWAKARLRQCLDDHKCGKQVVGRLPKRVLDIRADQVKLLETLGSEAQYVCLSHRWGGPEHKRLISTVTTIQDHKKGIPWTTLPRTFQDAVTICRDMGVSYLWIDTLCILQQSPGLTKAQIEITEKDFAEQNSVMANIYQGSYFTISADISTNMDSGIFATNIMPRCLPLKVNTGDDGRDATVYAKADWISHNRHRLDIETRGWTFQEFLLPPRVLHFGQFDITWRCQETHTCQCGAVGSGRYLWCEMLARAAKPVPCDRNEALEWWATVVQYYQPRKLSHGSDKLRALSGLAQIYAAETGDTYLAGLWKRSLIHDLCWFNKRNDGVSWGRRGPVAVGNRAAKRRAPSWSWTSIDTPDLVTSYFWSPGIHALHPIAPAGSQRHVCTVKNFICPPKTSDATGEVGECSIELEVKLISATISAFTPEQLPEEQIPWTIVDTDDGTAVQYCMPDCEMEDDDLKGGDKVYCAPIQEALTEVCSERGCVLLKHLQDQQYQRVGFCILTRQNPSLSDEEASELTRRTRLTRGLRIPESASKVQNHALHFGPDTVERILIV
ncbi:heterokaryon incompatibility protein-domain-containing protein [Hypoxylon rubiginosum]|uniref:Heterokaryon incompatibility protein-domain-containing protein n=1 Tax=Hypoxylon rubiginosum TaxID=110542 RepID=A0ACC0CSG0_9PEZI|nr:heterokaryon incompatibility protein-domain-containing protein [Hypoxylon rubiginosum]